jgi:Ca2+-transporting ATPase
MTPFRAGLGVDEARRRLADEGPNALPQSARRGLLHDALAVLREPMFLLLVGAAAIYVVLGDVREALVLAASLVVILVITIVQERRTENALEKLRDLSSPRALVIRDGREARIAGAEVVRGDLLVLREGDRVAADATLGESSGLHADESLLTGESVPVAKEAGGDETVSRVLSGTLVVKGHGRAIVTATGPRSELGRIGTSLAGVATGKTALERETAWLVRRFAVVGLALCVAFAILSTMLRGDALAGILAGLTLAMAVLPEEFPVVLTIFLALGAWRIAKHGVLTRRLPAVETLGSTTVLCCDKTGTLTENRMAVAETWRDGRWRGAGSWDEEDDALLRLAARACEPEPFDPMDRAIVAASRSRDSAAETATLERRYPFGEGFLAVAHGWRESSGEGRIALKGAPETVLALCDAQARADAAALAAVGEAAARGLRLLGVAEALDPAGEWPADLATLPWRFAGFVALADPLRAGVPAAIGLCRRAGIRVLMITGDHPVTAASIARQAGIDAREVMTGTELATLDEDALARAVRHVQVYARVRPEQKLRLVNALRAGGEVVAMTGDGVNDAPALRAADIGVAMGRRGTDVAREAAALVLLDDDFTSLVGTVRLGRRIYDNIRNATRYLIAVHVPLAGMAFIPLGAGWPLFFFPVHVVFLEFVIDPACSIVFEAERSDPGVMERPPRKPGERLFTRASIAVGVLLGLGVLAMVALVYGWALDAGRLEGEARALAFSALVAGNLALIFANRSHELTVLEMTTHENAALWWIVPGTLVALLATLYVPPVAQVFRFAPPAASELLAALACGFVSVAWYDLRKLARRRRPRTPPCAPSTRPGGQAEK